jgi:hypothetical protein
MDATIALALLLQLAGIVLLRHRVGQGWLRRPVTLLYLASVAYQGLPSLLLAFPTVRAQDSFRTGIAPQFTDAATLEGSAAMLALVTAYVLIQPQQVMARATDWDRWHAAAMLDWRPLALACVPLAALTYSGRGYNGGITLDGTSTPLATDLAATLFTVLVVVTAFGAVLRHPSWFLPVLLVQSGALAIAGERSPVIIDAVTLIVMLAFARVRPRAGQLRAAAALTLIAAVAVTAARAERGRSLYYADSGLSARVEALGSGVVSFGAAGQQGTSGLAAQMAGRLDGDAFAGSILQSQAMGQPRLSSAGVPESLLLLVPSAVWPSKLAHSATLNTVAVETNYFGLQQLNFLPTLPGLYAGFLPWPWLIAFLAFLGAVSGWCERWLLRECTPARLVLLAGAVAAALRYEEGLPGMLGALRAALIIVAVVKGAEAVRNRRRAAVVDATPLGFPA